jgi:hypothetical protein
LEAFFEHLQEEDELWDPGHPIYKYFQTKEGRNIGNEYTIGVDTLARSLLETLVC